MYWGETAPRNRNRESNKKTMGEKGKHNRGTRFSQQQKIYHIVHEHRVHKKRNPSGGTAAKKSQKSCERHWLSAMTMGCLAPRPTKAGKLSEGTGLANKNPTGEKRKPTKVEMRCGKNNCGWGTGDTKPNRYKERSCEVPRLGHLKLGEDVGCDEIRTEC